MAVVDVRTKRIRHRLVWLLGLVFAVAISTTVGYWYGSVERSLRVLGTENNVMLLILGGDRDNALLLTHIDAEANAHWLCEYQWVLPWHDDSETIRTQLTRLARLKNRLPPVPDLGDDFSKQLKTCLGKYSGYSADIQGHGYSGTDHD